MYAHDPKLLEAITNFDIDGRAAALSFEHRLARECGWSSAFARRVVAEYRRFLYLAMTAGHPVTPSDEVDQAWHLHLVYTDSYWRRLCGQVLPRPLHHNPTAGGESEDAKFNDWYERTRASYRAAFSQEPDPQVWPEPQQRFDPKRQFKRVRSEDWLMLPKRTLRRLAVVSAALTATPLLVGATMLGKVNLSDSMVALILCGSLFGVVVWGAWMSARIRSDGSSSSGGCGGIFSGCGGGGLLHHGDTGHHHGTGGHHGHGDAGGHDGGGDAGGAGDAGGGCSSGGCSGGGGCGGGGCGGGGCGS